MFLPGAHLKILFLHDVGVSSMAVTSVNNQSNQQASLFSHLVYLFSNWLINLQCQKGGYPSRFPLKLMQYAAENGHARAMSDLGCLLYECGACRTDKRSGIEYVRRAAKHNVCEAQYVLGQAYLSDDIFHQKNKQLAIHWLALAADNGHTQASRKLQAITRQDADKHQAGHTLRHGLQSQQRKTHSTPEESPESV